MPPFRTAQRPAPRAPAYRTNDRILAPQVRLIDETAGTNEIVPLATARQQAMASGLDLIEVVPTAVPPVVKIMDYGKFLYQLKKEEKKQKAKAKQSEMKEVRISLRIGKHDFDVKLEQSKRFLADGDRVRLNLRYRGREVVHADLGNARMQEFIAALGDTVVVEQPPKLLGKILSCIIRPK